MQRRDFVKAIVAATAAAAAPASAAAQELKPTKPTVPATPAPGPLPWTRGLNSAKPLPISPIVPGAIPEAGTQYFSERQMATLRHLCATFMPAADGYPDALTAGVPEFLDFLISVSPAERQQSYKSGLDRLEADARHQFNISFAEASAAQTDQLLRPWIRAWMYDHLPTEPYEHFINSAHNDIRTATMNSQAWAEAAVAQGKPEPDVDLYWHPIEPLLHHDGDAPAHKPAARRRPS